jgi:hypothetical protein
VQFGMHGSVWLRANDGAQVQARLIERIELCWL